jgi:hypothetical protein
MFNYSGDPGQYPILSMFNISDKFGFSKRIVFTTNAVSEKGNKGVFILTNDALGFISKSIFGLHEYHKLWLKPDIKTHVTQNHLLIRGRESMEIKHLEGRRNVFKEEWGNQYQTHDSFFFHLTNISLVLSSTEKAHYIENSIHFQIGAYQAEEEFDRKRNTSTLRF